MKLIEFMEDWLENYNKEFIKERTYIRYKSNINNYIRDSLLGNLDINNISRKDIQDYMNLLKKKLSIRTGKVLSNGTIKNTYVVLKSAFNYAIDYEILDKNPCERIKIINKNNEVIKEVKCFSIDEQYRIEKYILDLNNIDYYIYLIDLYTGLRIGELCALTWDDIDFNEKMLFVNKTVYEWKKENGEWTLKVDTPKTRTSIRSIPLPNHIIKLFKVLKKKSISNYVFTYKNGKQLSPWSCRYRYNEMLKTLNIKHINFHCLRHTFATRAIESGVDIKTLSEILGHSSASITLEFYAHSMDKHKREMMNKIKRLCK